MMRGKTSERNKVTAACSIPANELCAQKPGIRKDGPKTKVNKSSNGFSEIRLDKKANSNEPIKKEGNQRRTFRDICHSPHIKIRVISAFLKSREKHEENKPLKGRRRSLSNKSIEDPELVDVISSGTSKSVQERFKIIGMLASSLRTMRSAFTSRMKAKALSDFSPSALEASTEWWKRRQKLNSEEYYRRWQTLPAHIRIAHKESMSMNQVAWRQTFSDYVKERRGYKPSKHYKRVVARLAQENIVYLLVNFQALARGYLFRKKLNLSKKGKIFRLMRKPAKPFQKSKRPKKKDQKLAPKKGRKKC